MLETITNTQHQTKLSHCISYTTRSAKQTAQTPGPRAGGTGWTQRTISCPTGLARTGGGGGSVVSREAGDRVPAGHAAAGDELLEESRGTHAALGALAGRLGVLELVDFEVQVLRERRKNKYKH